MAQTARIEKVHVTTQHSNIDVHPLGMCYVRLVACEPKPGYQAAWDEPGEYFLRYAPEDVMRFAGLTREDYDRIVGEIRATITDLAAR